MREVYVDKETQKITRVVDNGAYILSLLFGPIYFFIKKCYLLALILFVINIIAISMQNNTIYLAITVLSCVYSKYLIKKSWEEQGFVKYEKEKTENNNQ